MRDEWLVRISQTECPEGTGDDLQTMQSSNNEFMLERALLRYTDPNRSKAVKSMLRLFQDPQLHLLLKEAGQKTEPCFRTALELATKLELAVHCRSKQGSYGRSIRERILILSSKHNLAVRAELIQGTLTPEQFALMDESEFNEQHNKLLENAKEWKLKSLQADFYLKHMTCKEGEITCFKCKSKKIYTTQRQMRSADEPMTT